ncbi:MAG: extracellular solute-binding protein [Tannerella sp.]|nr:extracellular solute-binding protein [Tannerella sp.]
MKRTFVGLLLAVYIGGLAQSVKAQIKDNLKGEISLSGVFALYPMVVKWAEEFKKIHPNVRIDISGGGAGKGMTDALAKVVDLGMVSRDVHDVELKKGAVAFAVVKDAVVPTVNAANPLIRDIKAKGLKRDAALNLWSGKYKTWGNVLGIASKVPVHVYTRSDACGAAETWAAWFGKRQEDLEGTAVFGDPGVASAVQKDKVGIGFNNIAYAYDQKTRRPYAGLAIIPLDVNGNGKIDPEENFYDNSLSLIKAIVSGKYPSPPARNLFLVSNGVPKKPEVVEFIKYILSEGQKYANATGYIGLSKTTINQELAKLKK